VTASRPAGAAALAKFVADSGRDDRSFWLDVQNAMSAAVVLVSPDRKLVYANQQAQSLLSLPVESAVGRPCTDILDCPQCECRCRLFETGEIDNVEVTLYVPEPRTFRKNGKILRGEDGEIIGGVETFTDVTHEVRERDELRQRDELLLRERRRSDIILENLSEGVVGLDRRLEIGEFSAHMQQLTGYAPEDAMGRPFLELFKVDLGFTPDGPASLAGQSVEADDAL